MTHAHRKAREGVCEAHTPGIVKMEAQNEIGMSVANCADHTKN